MREKEKVILRLYSVIKDRIKNNAENSYVNSLHKAGINKISEKWIFLILDFGKRAKFENSFTRFCIKKICLLIESTEFFNSSSSICVSKNSVERSMGVKGFLIS